MKYEPINLMVTAIGGGGHGEQILKALKLASPNRYNLFGGDMNSNCPQFKYVDKKVVLPKATDPNFIKTVLELCQKNNIKAVFHGCEPELLAYSGARALFAEQGVLLPINKSEVISLCMDKIRSSKFLSSHGFEHPQFIFADGINAASQLDSFPLVVKPHIGSGASKDCFIVQNQRELEAIIKFLDINSKNPMLIQEYVGTPEEEYTVGVLHDLDGNFINSIALRRELKSALNLRISVTNKTGKINLGPRLVISSGISMGAICKPIEILKTCEKIAKALDVRGAINLQGRMTENGFKVFEINPRFSGTTSIRAMMGYNEPDILIRKHIFGEEIQTRFEYEEGYVLRNLIETKI